MHFYSGLIMVLSLFLRVVSMSIVVLFILPMMIWFLHIVVEVKVLIVYSRFLVIRTKRFALFIN